MIATDISDATKALSCAGYLGIVWADENLVAQVAFGPFTASVPLGENICASVAALFGTERSLQALKDDNSLSFELPNVTTIDHTGASQRMSFVVRWHRERRQFLLFISRPIAIDETTIELQREARRRKLAEEEVLLQAKGIREANEALTAANQGLNEFTRIISHDLKAESWIIRGALSSCLPRLSCVVVTLVINDLAIVREGFRWH